MAPIVYSAQRARSPEAHVRSGSSRESTPSFQMASPTLSRGAKPADDTSYDTSVASAADKHAPHHAPDLETDLEESDHELPTMAGRMKKRSDAPAPLFFESDEEQDAHEARTHRMNRLLALARERAPRSETDPARTSPQLALSSSPSPASPPPPPPQASSPPQSPHAVPSRLDASSDSDVDLPAPAAPRAKGLSRKEQREMHSMSARLRREHRVTLERREPKRYQLSELLSTIQHAETRPEPQSSSDPVESSSTAPRSTPEPAPRPVAPPHAFTDLDKERVQRKWAMLRAQQPHEHDSDNDIEVVDLREPKPSAARHGRSRDTDRAEADAQLVHLGAAPRTPHKQRIASDAYRSPNTHAPSPARVSDHAMNAAAHAFALAAHKEAGTLPPSSPTHEACPSPHKAHAPKQAPMVMDLAQLNETLLHKAYAQNAQRAAKHTRARKAPAGTESAPPPAADAAPASAPEHAADADADSDADRDAATPSDLASEASLGADPPSTHSGSEKENVPLSPILPADEGELEVDLGRFFAPTQAPSQRQDSPLSSPRTLQDPAPVEERSARSDSNSSVLAQFFESTQDQPARGASLDLFANRQRDGPVGGMTQFFEPTPSASQRFTRSQEAMPPPSHAPSTDGFAALRRQQHEDAQALLSPEMLPSLDPSLAEHPGAWHERPAPSNEVMYINQDGFFTQTKPAEDAPSQAPGAWPPPSQRIRALEEDAPTADADDADDASSEAPVLPSSSASDASDAGALSDVDSEDPAGGSNAQAHAPSLLASRAPAKAPRERSAFVFGEAEESDEEELRNEHGGLAGVFSDRGSDSEPEEGSEDDADLESLLDDEEDEDRDAQDAAARSRYMQHREEDDAAVQALHERATKGMLRNRRRRLDDPLADILDEDADEDELRRKLHAPSFQPKRRRIEQDGLQALAAREDSQAFVQTYNETHATEDADRYDFLGADSSDEERVTAHDVRAELRRHALDHHPVVSDASSDEDAFVAGKLRPRLAKVPRATDEEESELARLVFTSGQVDAQALPREAQERRARLLEEYSNEPHWQQERGGRYGIDRRRTGHSKRATPRAPQPQPNPPTRSAPSVLVNSVLRRTAQFAPP